MTIYSNGTLHLSGAVGDHPGDEHFTLSMVRIALERHGSGPIAIEINSPGGYADEGIAIYNKMKAHPGRVTVRVMALAASAASIITMAGDEIEIGRASTLMIHEAGTTAAGGSDDMRRAQDRLDDANRRMAEIYATRTGRPIDYIQKLMKKETWLTGADAVSQGFADRVFDQDALPAVACAKMLEAYAHPPKLVANLVRQRSPLAEAVERTNRRIRGEYRGLGGGRRGW